MADPKPVRVPLFQKELPCPRVPISFQNSRWATEVSFYPITPPLLRKGMLCAGAEKLSPAKPVPTFT